eukprot:155884_1
MSMLDEYGYSHYHWIHKHLNKFVVVSWKNYNRYYQTKNTKLTSMGSIQNTCCGGAHHSKSARRNKYQENMTKISILNKAKSKQPTIANIKSPPKMMEFISNTLNEDEQNIGATDIQRNVFEGYSTPKGLSEESEEFEESESEISELSSIGLQEMGIRRSNKLKLNDKQGTKTCWSESGLIAMQNEMRRELEQLKNLQDDSPFAKNNSNQLHNDADGPSLYRTKSPTCWSKTDVIAMDNDMQMQLEQLLITSTLEKQKLIQWPHAYSLFAKNDNNQLYSDCSIDEYMGSDDYKSQFNQHEERHVTLLPPMIIQKVTVLPTKSTSMENMEPNDDTEVDKMLQALGKTFEKYGNDFTREGFDTCEDIVNKTNKQKLKVIVKNIDHRSTIIDKAKEMLK